MRSLFLKIFLWFWGATIIIGAALYLVVFTVRPDPLPEAWRTTAEDALRVTGNSAITQWRNGGSDALYEYFTNEGHMARSRFWLFDIKGVELSGNALPPEDGRPDEPPPRSGEAGRLPGLPFKNPLTEPFPFFNGARPTAQQVRRLYREALDSTDAMFEVAGPRVICALEVDALAGRFVIVATQPRPDFGRQAAEPGAQLLGSAVIVLLSGLVCYALVLYLTRPLVQLRAATLRLSEGDLTARTDAARSKRRDEVADLGRDFDAMATRIEALIGSQRQLLGDISHELRSPLTRVAMLLALARRQADQGQTGEEMTATLDRIGREATRLNALIGQLLELTRLESGESAMEEEVDVEQIVREIVADADFEAQHKECRVLLTQCEPCLLQGSRELLHSAIENVVRNAVRHTRDGTSVEVELEQEGGCTVVRVRDHGPGVPEEELERIFHPFFRIDSARGHEKGVGLGLAITERAITSHGGTVLALNDPEGGLQVELRLPSRKAAE